MTSAENPVTPSPSVERRQQSGEHKHFAAYNWTDAPWSFSFNGTSFVVAAHGALCDVECPDVDEVRRILQKGQK